MASNYFLEIEGIEGESADDKHKGALEIESFSWGLTQLGSFAGRGGGAAGKASFQDFHFTKLVDKASPKLFFACASGEHIKKATLFVRKSGERHLDYYQVSLQDVLVSSYQSAGADGNIGAVPVDSFALNYAKIVFSYTPQNGDGTALPAVQAGWDLIQNKKI